MVSWYAHTSSLCYCHKWFHSWSLLGWQQTRLSTACSYILGSVERVEDILSLDEKCKVKLHQQNQLWLPRTEDWNRPTSQSSLFQLLQSLSYTKTLSLSKSTTLYIVGWGIHVITFSVCGQSTQHTVTTTLDHPNIICILSVMSTHNSFIN